MRAIALMTLAVLAAGCAVGPDYERPAVELPRQYPEGEAPGATQVPIAARWWELYGDATLNGLVATALERNPDVRLAVARIEEADAVLREAGATFLPEIDAGVNANRSRVSAGTAFPNPPPLIRNDVRLALSTSFELDFWGRLRRAREAARAQALGSRFGGEVVSLSLAGLVVQDYFLVRSLDTQIALATSTLAARQDSLGVARARARGGLASDLDVNQAVVSVTDASIQLKDLLRQRELAEHQLATLTGRLDMHLPSVPDGNAQIAPLPQLPIAGLPSTLLDRRPDVRQAEQALVSSNAQIGVAKAAYFPTISLLAGNGGESAALSSVLDNAARIWSVGIGATMPLLDWGRTAARVDAAEARRDQAIASYQKVAQTAYREVADALTGLRQAMNVQQDLEDRAVAARNTLKLVNTRYRSGYSAYLEVLDAQRTANDADLAVARNRLTLLDASVDLMKALGGGW
jgi:multidrug efflux system outer membrane protein